MTPGELKALLDRHEIRAIKGRSQHFLLDMTVVEDMVKVADLKKDEVVVEIGPGPGVLTDALVATGAKVVAVELDQKLTEILRERFGDRIHLIFGDILEQTGESLLRAGGKNPETGDGSSKETDYKIVANIPYAITSGIITGFIEEKHPPQSMTLLVQREVAERICAKPGEMSALAVLAQTYGEPSIIRNVARGAFLPPPRVESSVLHIALRNKKAQTEWFGDVLPESYFLLVRTAFTHKRKKLRNTLRGAFKDDSELEACFKAAHINPDARPEELMPDDWRRLTAMKK